MIRKKFKFQEKAILELLQKSNELIHNDERNPYIVFESPTGSGKTFMVNSLMAELSKAESYSYIWISFNPDNAKQSYEKLSRNTNGDITSVNLEQDVVDIVAPSSCLFMNWQQVTGKDVEAKKLTRKSEKFPLGQLKTIIKNTLNSNKVILIIDEAHIASDTFNANEIRDIIDASLTITVSATPKNVPTSKEEKQGKASHIFVNRQDVVDEGLIKKSVIVQTEEDLKNIEKDGVVRTLIYSAVKKLDQQKDLLSKSNINPLLLIQLPPESKGTIASELFIVEIKENLKKAGIKDDEISIWFSEKKVNLEGIAENSSKVRVLIFKVAAATGWDAPRAINLIMFRNTKSKVLFDQTLGRIIRQPLLRAMEEDLLDNGFLFTNYDKNTLIESFKNVLSIKAAFSSQKRHHIEQITLKSFVKTRQEYNDIKVDIVETFAKSKKLASEISRDKSVKSNLVVGGSLTTDSKEGLSTSKVSNTEISEYDANIRLEQEIIQFLREQKDDTFFAPLRSAPRVKSALTTIIKFKMDGNQLSNFDVTKTLINSFNQSGFKNELIRLINDYREIYHQREAKDVYREVELKVPLLRRDYSSAYEKHTYNKSADEHTFFIPNKIGNKNELSFIENVLETDENIEWWWKNSDYGAEYFAVPYEEEGKDHLFYPDFIIKTITGKIYILDTKKGKTFDDAGSRIDALVKYSKKMNFIPGLVVENDSTGIWYLHDHVQKNHYNGCILKFK